jgi:hypothetical protein
VGGNVEIIEMDRMRKLIADHMVRSKATSPHVTSFTEADFAMASAVLTASAKPLTSNNPSDNFTLHTSYWLASLNYSDFGKMFSTSL